MNIDAAMDFGAYLKSLRADRRLSLESAERIAKQCKETVSASYLSRLESGKATPKLTKLATLARIYDVPLHALVDRFEWSRRVNPVEQVTHLSSFKQFQQQLDHLWKQGEHLKVLALTGEARARKPPWLDDAHADIQLSHAECNALVQLGFYELAKLQVERQLSRDALTPTQERRFWSLYVSCCHRLERFALAESGLQCYEAARLNEAKEVKEPRQLLLAKADGAMLRGNLAMERKDFRTAIAEYIHAVRDYTDARSSIREARAKASLGSAWIETGKLRAAHRTLVQAWKVASENEHLKVKLFANIRLAALESARQNYSACERWAHEARNLAEQLEHRAMKFASTWYLYLSAASGPDHILRERYEKQLKQWLPHADSRQPEVQQFKAHHKAQRALV